MAKTSGRKSPSAKKLEQGKVALGAPDLRPTAGYVGKEPVRFSDETAEQFQGRKASFDASLASAQKIGTPSAAHVAAMGAAPAKKAGSRKKAQPTPKKVPAAKKEPSK